MSMAAQAHAGRLSRLPYVVPAVFLALFFFYPLGTIFWRSASLDGRTSFASYATLWQEPYFFRALWFTSWQAALSTLLTLLVGMPGAYVLAHYRLPGKRLLFALTTVPFVLPVVVVAAAFTALLGPRGWLNGALMTVFALDSPPLQLHQTIWMILAAHVFYNAAVVIRVVGNFWAGLDPKLSEAARLLGASRPRAFREVTLPLLSPAIWAAGMLVFLFCFTSFGVIMILGGARFATIEVEIYRQAITLFRLPVAAAMSLAQMILTLLLMSAYTRLQARVSYPIGFRPAEEAARRISSAQQAILVGLVIAATLSFVLLPMGSLAARSLAPQDAWLYYRELVVNRTSSIFYVPPVIAIRNSLVFASATMFLAVTMGTATARLLARSSGRVARVLEPLALLPLGTSAVTLGFGFILAMGRPPFDLRASPVLVPIAHSLVAFPFVVRTMLPALRGLNPGWSESALLLGASPWQVLREVELPIVGRALLVSATFSFTISMGEFGATLLIARPEYPTMPLVIYRLLGQPGALNYGQAMAMSTILMAVCAVSFIVIERFRGGGLGEF
jgi:thiamine transport system permease protein